MTGAEFPPELDELRRGYAEALPAKVGEIAGALEAFLEASPDRAPSAFRDLRTLVHRLAGSAGSYGFPEVTRLARAWEEELVEQLGTGKVDAGQARRRVDDLSRLADEPG